MIFRNQKYSPEEFIEDSIGKHQKKLKSVLHMRMEKNIPNDNLIEKIISLKYKDPMSYNFMSH